MSTLTSLDIKDLRDPVEEYCGILAQRWHFTDVEAHALIVAARKMRALGASRAFACRAVRKVAMAIWACRALTQQQELS